jgi:hypothetical protein
LILGSRTIAPHKLFSVLFLVSDYPFLTLWTSLHHCSHPQIFLFHFYFIYFLFENIFFFKWEINMFRTMVTVMCWTFFVVFTYCCLREQDNSPPDNCPPRTIAPHKFFSVSFRWLYGNIKFERINIININKEFFSFLLIKIKFSVQ